MAIFPTLVPTAMDHLADSTATLADGFTSNVPKFGNAAICVDSLTTTGRAGLNFYCSPNPVAKSFFGISCLCGAMGVTNPLLSLTIALKTHYRALSEDISISDS